MRRLTRALGVAAAAALCLAAQASPARAGGARVAVWPRSPGDDVAGVDAAVRDAGFAPVSIDPIRDRLRAQGDRAAAAETAALDAIQAALAAARASYLQQDFAAMAAGLAQAEAAALPVLALPRHAAVLWELQLQRGLAELRRDPDAARARFAFALALDESRAPRRELYGPAVARAFAEVADARAQVPPRPTALAIEPRDARVAIDGVPVVDNAAPRMLRPGLHVVAVAAPGYQDQAAIVEVRSGAAIRIALAPAAGDAVERLGAAWAAGTADAGTESGRRAIAAVVAELGAAAAVVVGVDRGRGDAGARVIAAGEASAIERRSTAAAAAAAALAHLAPDGSTIRRDVPAGGRGGSGGGGRRSVLRSWWLWTAVGGVAAAVGAGLVIEARSDRTIRVLPPAP
jgi:hypothetical protein